MYPPRRSRCLLRHLLLGLAISAVLTATLALAPQAPSAAAGTCENRSLDHNLVPSCGALLGTTDRHQFNLDLHTQENRLGDKFDLVRIYKVGPDAEFFKSHEREIAASGRTLVYTWKVTTQGADIAPWARVARGDFDQQLRRVAHQIANSGHKVIFGLHHEPENDPSFGTDDDYVAMYQRAHAIMEPIAGDDLVWFISYMGHSTGQLHRAESMYPGDHVIDWIAFNPYNWAGCHQKAPWESFAKVAAPFYQWAQAHHPDKPLMIAETGVVEDPNDRSAKARWIDDLSVKLQHEFSAIRAVLWFNHSVASGFCEWRWDSSAESSQAMRRLRSTPHFGGGTDSGVGEFVAPAPKPPTDSANRHGVSWCKVTWKANGLSLDFQADSNASAYVYRLDHTNQPSAYGEIAPGGYIHTAGHRPAVYLSAKYAEGSYSPALPCGYNHATISPPDAAGQCWGYPVPGGVHIEWHPVTGFAEYVVRVSLPHRADSFLTTPLNWAIVQLPKGTPVTLAAGAKMPDGSYTQAAPCGSFNAG